MNTLVCVKRVPESSGEVALTADGMHIDGRHAGWTTSAHEECAVEIAAGLDGPVTVLTVGGPDAVDQLRAALSVGATEAIHVLAEADDLGPADVASEIAVQVRRAEEAGNGYDLVLLGNDAADSGDFQVGVRLAYLLDRPVVVGAQTISVDGGRATMRVEGAEGTDVFEVDLPAVATVLEGGVEPRYPSMVGRMKAKKAPLDEVALVGQSRGSGRVSLRVPAAPESRVEILGEGAGAAGRVVEVLSSLGVASR